MNKINRKAFADNLWALLSKRDISMTTLARGIGVKGENVAKWLHQESDPSVKNVKAIHDRYDISYDELLKGI